jgi:hypothetical protein
VAPALLTAAQLLASRARAVECWILSPFIVCAPAKRGELWWVGLGSSNAVHQWQRQHYTASADLAGDVGANITVHDKVQPLRMLLMWYVCSADCTVSGMLRHSYLCLCLCAAAAACASSAAAAGLWLQHQLVQLPAVRHRLRLWQVIQPCSRAIAVGASCMRCIFCTCHWSAVLAPSAAAYLLCARAA